MLMAIDPAFANTGWVLAEKGTIFKSGIIITKPSTRKTHSKTFVDAERAQKITKDLLDVIEEYEVQGIVSEIPAGSQSARAAKLLGTSVGLMIGLCTTARLPIDWYMEGSVKEALCGRRDANKRDMIEAAVDFVGGKKKEKQTNAGTRRDYFICGEWWPYGKAEHIADAIGVYVAARSSNLVLLYG